MSGHMVLATGVVACGLQIQLSPPTCRQGSVHPRLHEVVAPTLMWLKDGNLSCDTCDQQFDYAGPRVVVLNAARAKGWHLFKGTSLTGKPLDKHLCTDCIGTARTPRTKPEPLSGEETLF